MNTLQQQVRRAQVRLRGQQFLDRLPGWCCAFLCVALVLTAVDKFWPLGVQSWAWAAGALGAGVLSSLAHTLWRGASDTDAAIEIDRRFGLKERVSSALSLPSDVQETEIGRTLVQDALRRVEPIDVPEKFGFELSRRAWWPLVPAALCIGLLFLELPHKKATAEVDPVIAQQQEQIKQEAEQLRQRLAERRRRAAEAGLEEMEDIFEQVERGTEELASAERADPKEALVQLNNLADQLEQRRDELGGVEQMQQQLDKLGDLQSEGPGEELAEALQEGDFQRAQQELQQLREQMQAGQLDAQAQQQLAEQLQELQQQMEQLLAETQDQMNELQQQVAELRQAGRQAEADALQQQLDKLAQQSTQMQQLGQMAQRCGQCAAQLRNGQTQQAMEALQSMEAELSQLAEQAGQMEMLSEALQEISECRNGMCQGRGQRQGRRPGMGLGRGRGQGDRPEEEGDTGFYDTQVRQQYDRGAAVVVGEADGPNVRGQIEQQIQAEYAAVQGQQADAGTDVRLERGYREHARDYFDSLREGE